MKVYYIGIQFLYYVYYFEGCYVGTEILKVGSPGEIPMYSVLNPITDKSVKLVYLPLFYNGFSMF